MSPALSLSDPFGCRFLYTTYSNTADLKLKRYSALIYYSYLIAGISLSIIVGSCEYCFRKGFEYLRSDFRAPNRFDLYSWKTECKLWQIEAAITTVADLIFEDFNPFETSAYAPMVQDRYYLASLRISNQWRLMDEKSHEITTLKEGLNKRLTCGMNLIIDRYRADMQQRTDQENSTLDRFREELSEYAKCLNAFNGYSLTAFQKAIQPTADSEEETLPLS